MAAEIAGEEAGETASKTDRCCERLVENKPPKIGQWMVTPKHLMLRSKSTHQQMVDFLQTSLGAWSTAPLSVVYEWFPAVSLESAYFCKHASAHTLAHFLTTQSMYTMPSLGKSPSDAACEFSFLGMLVSVIGSEYSMKSSSDQNDSIFDKSKKCSCSLQQPARS